jgi:hypothetical protein
LILVVLFSATRSNRGPRLSPKSTPVGAPGASPEVNSESSNLLDSDAKNSVEVVDFKWKWTETRERLTAITGYFVSRHPSITVTLKNKSRSEAFSGIRYRTEYYDSAGLGIDGASGELPGTLFPLETKTYDEVDDGPRNGRATSARFFVVGARRDSVSGQR